MSYSDEGWHDLEDEFVGMQGRCNDLIAEYMEKEFTNEKVKGFVRHGLCRRLSLMTRCIEKVVEVLPPDSEQAPDADMKHDLTVHLQAFVFNAYGCLDNLAQIWVLEENVTLENGNPLPRTWVGLGSQNKVVLNSLPDDFTDYLFEIRDWYENLQGFRHALAHRIPLYIPPGFLTDEKAEEYVEIQTRINEAVRRQNFELADRLEEEQAGLLEFHPIAAHSLGESANIFYFHAQMLSGFHMVREIANKLLSCFDR